MPAGNTEKQSEHASSSRNVMFQLVQKLQEMGNKQVFSPLKREIALTYLIFVTAVISVHECWSSIPQGLVHNIAQPALFDSGQVLQNSQSVLKVSIRLDYNLH